MEECFFFLSKLSNKLFSRIVFAFLMFILPGSNVRKSRWKFKIVIEPSKPIYVHLFPEDLIAGYAPSEARDALVRQVSRFVPRAWCSGVARFAWSLRKKGSLGSIMLGWKGLFFPCQLKRLWNGFPRATLNEEKELCTEVDGWKGNFYIAVPFRLKPFYLVLKV